MGNSVSDIVTFRKDQFSLINGKLVQESSMLELNNFPMIIMVLDEKNAGFLFRRSHPDFSGDDIAGYHYFSDGGAELLLIND